jgi:hypothetical protein
VNEKKLIISKNYANTNIKTDDIAKGSIIKLPIDINREDQYKSFKLTRQQFKDQNLAQYSDVVVYVDLQKHLNRICIRCNSNESAMSLIKDKNCLSNFKKYILEGEEEIDYMANIIANRSKKIDKKNRTKEIINIEPSTTKNMKIINSNKTEKIPSKNHFRFD